MYVLEGAIKKLRGFQAIFEDMEVRKFTIKSLLLTYIYLFTWTFPISYIMSTNKFAAKINPEIH